MKLRSLTLLGLLVASTLLGAAPAQADPPAAVTDLQVQTGLTSAVGAFTMPAGADAWELRYWDSSMSEAGWSGYYFGKNGYANEYATVCALIPEGNLDDCHTFYWAVRVSGTGGWSNVSNQEVKATRCAPQYGEVECP